jgi:hypothetical protein
MKKYGNMTSLKTQQYHTKDSEVDEIATISK